MLNSIQIELMKRGVAVKGYILLIHMKDTFFADIKGAYLQKIQPMFFSSSSDVKAGFEELHNAKIIDGRYDGGNIYDIVPNMETIYQMQNTDTTTIPKVKKRPAKILEEKKEELDDSILNIVKHYQSLELLPRPANLTHLASIKIKALTSKHSVETILEAITFASEQRWLQAKGDETWCNMSWVMTNLESFMAGGKYRKDIKTDCGYKQKEDDGVFFL